MPSVTITLTDTPTGGVAIHSDFKPAVGNPISAAQAHALEIINRTHKQWGVKPQSTEPEADRRPGVSAIALRIAKENPNLSVNECASRAKAEYTRNLYNAVEGISCSADAR